MVSLLLSAFKVNKWVSEDSGVRESSLLNDKSCELNILESMTA